MHHEIYFVAQWFKVDDTRMAILPIHVPSHWICAFVDFDYKYLAIFDSWEREPVPNDDWKESNHAHIFCVRRNTISQPALTIDSSCLWNGCNAYSSVSKVQSIGQNGALIRVPW